MIEDAEKTSGAEEEVINTEELAELREFEHDTEHDEDGVEAAGDEEVESEFDKEVAEGTELDSFESADIEEIEFVASEQMLSILESVLFATDKPQSVATIKQAFKGTNIKTKQIKEGLHNLAVELAEAKRGVTLEEVAGGYQLRTKADNMTFLKRMAKGRSFRLSGPALEVLAIVAYKQPCIKADVDEVRGVESGHLLRGLMERSLCTFVGKSDLPGKPMLYGTTKKFLEIFGLRNLRELPSLGEIDELIPEGIGDIEEKEETLDEITSDMAKDARSSYSEGEEELTKITDQLSDINTSSEFFEQEKQRMKDKREAERAQDIRDALAVGEEVLEKDKRWLERYDAKAAEEAEVAEVLGEEASGNIKADTDTDTDTDTGADTGERAKVFGQGEALDSLSEAVKQDIFAMEEKDSAQSPMEETEMLETITLAGDPEDAATPEKKESTVSNLVEAAMEAFAEVDEAPKKSEEEKLIKDMEVFSEPEPGVDGSI